jgi:antitoxin component of RelBE/YafQ-DinJ toxin-antitoxin module
MSTTTKTIGSRVNNEVHTLFTDVCNNEGITLSQKINQLVTDCVSFPSKTENKVESEPIIKSEAEKLLDELKDTPEDKLEFEQNSAMKKLLEELPDKNIRIKKQQVTDIVFGTYLDELKQSIQNLKTKMDTKLDEDTMKKGMACFTNDSCLD